MAQDDKKEYRDTLLLLSHMGSGPAVLNKLDVQAAKLEDPRLKQMLSQVGSAFRQDPETAHRKKFRLLNFADHYSVEFGSRQAVAKAIHAIRDYCQKHVASHVPQWQLIVYPLITGHARKIIANAHNELQSFLGQRPDPANADAQRHHHYGVASGAFKLWLEATGGQYNRQDFDALSEILAHIAAAR